MWCSRIRDLFRKILEENPRILSKNGYIIIYGKLYENDKVHNGYPTDYIYCSVCDSLVFIKHGTRNRNLPKPFRFRYIPKLNLGISIYFRNSKPETRNSTRNI